MGFIYAFLPKEREHSRQQVHGECKRAEQELTTTTATPFDRCCDRNNDFRDHQGASELEFKNSFSAIKKHDPLLIMSNMTMVIMTFPGECQRTPPRAPSLFHAPTS
jgi:hypothetical protein